MSTPTQTPVGGQTRTVTPGTPAADGLSGGDQKTGDLHPPVVAAGPFLADPVLGILAEVVDDLERVRCANENRYRSLTDTSDRGYGLSADHPDVQRLAATVEMLKDHEHQAILNLNRVMRHHPLWPWAKPLRGVGEKQLARLLSLIGDPYWNDLHNRPRRLTELRAYCGFHVLHPGGHELVGSHVPNAAGVAPKRQRGQRANWNDEARKRAWLIATSCMKQPPGSRYRDVYDQTRVKYAEAVHQVACVRCGPAGKPALPGSPISAGHQNARALRAVAKAFLDDLWRESRRLHGDQDEVLA